MDDSHRIVGEKSTPQPAPVPAALRLPDKILTKIFVFVMQDRHFHGRYPQYPAQSPLIKCLTLSKRFYDIVLPIWLGDSRLDLCTTRGRAGLQYLFGLRPRELVQVLEIKFHWIQSVPQIATLTAFRNLHDLRIDFGPGAPKDSLGRISPPPRLKDVLGALPRLDSLLFYPPVLIDRDWAPALSNLREFNSDYISLNADLQWCLSKSRMSNLVLVADGTKKAIAQGSEIGLIPWGPALKQLTFGGTPNVGSGELSLAMRHCFRATQLLAIRPSLSRIAIRIIRTDDAGPDEATQLGIALASLCNCPDVYIECHSALTFARAVDTPDDFPAVRSMTLYAAVHLYKQSNSASFLAFLKRFPNLERLDLGFFVLAPSQTSHCIENMGERKLARNFPWLFSLLQCLISTSLLEIYVHSSHHVSGAARWQRDELSIELASLTGSSPSSELTPAVDAAPATEATAGPKLSGATSAIGLLAAAVTDSSSATSPTFTGETVAALSTDSIAAAVTASATPTSSTVNGTEVAATMSATTDASEATAAADPTSLTFDLNGFLAGASFDPAATAPAAANPKPLGVCTWNALSGAEWNSKSYTASAVLDWLDRLLETEADDGEQRSLAAGAIKSVLLDDGWQDSTTYIDYDEPDGDSHATRKALKSFACRREWYDLDEDEDEEEEGDGEEVAEARAAAQKNKKHLLNSGYEGSPIAAQLRQLDDEVREGTCVKLRDVVSRIKEKGIEKVGVWMTLAGYWDGLHPEGALADTYTLRRVTLRSPVDGSDQGHMYLPVLADLRAYYTDYFSSLHAAGIDFVKVDDQSKIDWFFEHEVAEEDEEDAAPEDVGELRQAMLREMRTAAARIFGKETGTVIHCMAGSPRVFGGDLAVLGDPAGAGRAVIRNSDD